MNREITHIRHFFVASTFAFVILLIASLVWNIKREEKVIVKMAKKEALGNFNQDVTYRKWASKYGGIYLPISDSLQPNKHLQFIKNRDIQTIDGQKLTLVNPAYMSRLVFDMTNSDFGRKSHITSLNPIRPENKADQWETKALLAFEKGETEYSSIEKIDNKEYLRFMKPLIVEQSCLKCHEEQGYRLGDTRGGISISMDMNKYIPISNTNLEELIYTHLIIGILGLLIGFLAYRRTIIAAKDNHKSKQKITASEILLRQQNEELKIAKNKAVESDRLKSIFLQNMSHEIRTPMNAILGFSSLLPDEFDNKEKLAEFTRIINQRGNDLMCILNDILDLSRIESERIEMHYEEFDLESFIDDIESIAYSLQARFEKFEVDFLRPRMTENLILFTDQGKLKQIFTNLISNAYKFTDKGHIEIKFCVKDERIRFTVSDTGIGIPESETENIFNRFAQVDQGDTRIHQGTGLGLSIVKELVKLLEGEISVTSVLNYGTSFYLEIPLISSHKKSIQASLQFELS